MGISLLPTPSSFFIGTIGPKVFSPGEKPLVRCRIFRLKCFPLFPFCIQNGIFPPSVPHTPNIFSIYFYRCREEYSAANNFHQNAIDTHFGETSTWKPKIVLTFFGGVRGLEGQERARAVQVMSSTQVFWVIFNEYSLCHQRHKKTVINPTIFSALPFAVCHCCSFNFPTEIWTIYAQQFSGRWTLPEKFPSKSFARKQFRCGIPHRTR